MPPGTKIDPGISIMMLESKKQLKAVKYENIFSINKEVIEPEIEIIVKTNKSFKDLENIQGLKIHSKINEFFTATIPLSSIAKLAAISNVLFIEASVKCKKILDPLRNILFLTGLDVSVPGIKVDSVRNSSGFKGKNVILGIVDSGIDFKHYDFRNIDGTTRIKYIWDQTISLQSGESGPAGYGYGVEYNQDKINNSLTSSSVREKDDDGHGTHVAGIGAGNGLETGNSKPAGTYVGCATEGDLIVVKTTFSTSAVVDAVNYIFSKATSLNQAAVVNLSIGTHIGPHDGKSTFESSLDSASGAGKIIVAAAGNDGNKAIHFSGTAPATVSFNTLDSTLSYITIWYKGADSLNVSVDSPDDGAIANAGPVSPGNSVTVNDPAGRIIIQSTTNISYNNDKNIIIQIDNGGGSAVTKGEWNFTLSAGSITNGKFDVWSYDSSYTTFNSPDYDYTLSMPATASKVISVSAWTTKKTWKSIDNNSYSTSETVDTISSFSSRGPTRDGRQKPDLTAPGSVIASSMSSSVTFSNTEVMTDGKHVVMQGTSMACPHVTGAVSLLLQKNRTLTPEQVITALTGTTVKDANTGSVWNKYWGYGKFDALAAINSISTNQNLTPEITEHYNYPNPAKGNKVTFYFNTNVNSSATIKVFNIAGELVAKIESDAASGNNKVEWEISDASPGIYFYILYLKSKDDGTEIKTKPAKIAIIK